MKKAETTRDEEESRYEGSRGRQRRRGKPLGGTMRSDEEGVMRKATMRKATTRKAETVRMSASEMRPEA